MTNRFVVFVSLLLAFLLQWACTQSSGPTAEEKQNKTTVERIFTEFVNQANEATFDELVDANLKEHEQLPPGFEQSSEGVKQMFRAFRGGFPDLNFKIDQLIAADDKVVIRLTVTGTHEGQFMNMPATGKKVSYSVIDIFRLANGKIIEHWGISDNLTMMTQLGVIPEGPPD
jgi:steroid delta-isomerase-like uncharacterized protein